MIAYPPALQSIVGSPAGVAGVHLLDVMDANGNFYYWASRRIVAPAVMDAASAAGGSPVATPTYDAWILQSGPWKFNRSLQTDTGTIRVQYLSGNTVWRDFDRIMRSNACMRAPFVYRYWSAAAEAAMREIHGTLTVGEPDGMAVPLSCRQLSDFSTDAMPRFTLSEICPLLYGGTMCGATSGVECQHSIPTCQVLEHTYVISNSYEKNFGEAAAVVSQKIRNRARKV